MSHAVVRISVRSVLPIAAVLFLMLGLFASCVAALGVWLAPGPVTSVSLTGPIRLDFAGPPPVGVFVLYPLLSAVAGAAAASGLAWFYNLVAARVGPVRVTLQTGARQHSE